MIIATLNNLLNNSKLNLMCLFSDGGVHSHIAHLFSLLDLCDKKNFKNVYLHLFTDGRDTDPKSGIGFIDKVNKSEYSGNCDKYCSNWETHLPSELIGS